MTRLKMILSVVMCGVILMCAAACGKEKENDVSTTTTIVHNTEVPDKPTVSEGESATFDEQQTDIPKLNFTLYDLYEANRISNLLSIYKSLKTVDVMDDATYTEYYFTKNDKVACINKWEYNDGYKSLAGWYRGADFVEDDGRIYSDIKFENLGKNAEFPYEYKLSAGFDRVTVELIEEGSDYYVIRTEGIFETAENEYTNTYTIDKGTLAITKAVYQYGSSDIITETKFEYGAYVENTELLDGWSAPLRTITVISEQTTESSHSTLTTKIELPADWELRIMGDGEIAVYLDEGYTQYYEYPGDGKDYTLYATTSLG